METRKSPIYMVAINQSGLKLPLVHLDVPAHLSSPPPSRFDYPVASSSNHNIQTNKHDHTNFSDVSILWLPNNEEFTDRVSLELHFFYFCAICFFVLKLRLI